MGYMHHLHNLNKRVFIGTFIQSPRHSYMCIHVCTYMTEKSFRVFNHELILINTNNKICMSRVCVFLCRDSHTSTHKSFWKISPFTWSTISSRCYLAASQSINWQDFLHCIEMLANRQPALNNTNEGRKKSVHIWCCEQKKSYSCPYVKTEEYCAKNLETFLMFQEYFTT